MQKTAMAQTTLEREARQIVNNLKPGLLKALQGVSEASDQELFDLAAVCTSLSFLITDQPTRHASQLVIEVRSFADDLKDKISDELSRRNIDLSGAHF